jgi:protein O-mannosyl-transferase
LLSLLTWHQIGYWQNTLDLWSHTLDVTNDNEVAEENLGSALQGLGRIEESLPHFRNGARIAPEQVVVHVNLAATLAQTGHYQEAVPEYEASIRLGPRPNVLPVIYADLGTTYLKLEDLAKSRESYEHALQLDPQQPAALQGMQQLQREESIQQLRLTIASQPTDAGYLRLGQLQLEAGRLAEAGAAYQQALRLNPKLTQARQALAAIEASGR